MADTQATSGGDGQWEVSDDAIQDPEEIKVLFCALDSFLYVPGASWLISS